MKMHTIFYFIYLSNVSLFNNGKINAIDLMKCFANIISSEFIPDKSIYFELFRWSRYLLVFLLRVNGLATAFVNISHYKRAVLHIG